jgi:hypothetical protein
MSWAFDLYYEPPANRTKEETLTQRVGSLGGRFDYREERAGICLTYEFDDEVRAEQAAELLREQGEHVEGPYDYGE